MRRRVLDLPIVVLVVLISVFGFAAAADAITINGSMDQSGPLVFQFRTDPNMNLVDQSFTQRDGGYDLTSDAGMTNISMTGQDLAITTGVMTSNSGDGVLDTLSVSVDKPYDGYYNKVSFMIGNIGTDVIVMPAPVLNWLGQPVPLADGVVTPLYDAAGNQVAEVRWLGHSGEALCATFVETFEFHVLSAPPPPPPPTSHDLKGLTPGYWKNWRNHYTADQFTVLLAGTIAADITSADAAFAHYNAKQSDPLTILRAQLLATQLTVNLCKIPAMPNPDGAYLSMDSQVYWNNGTVTVGEAVTNALNILANPSASRSEILGAKDLLDYINNLDQASSL